MGGFSKTIPSVLVFYMKFKQSVTDIKSLLLVHALNVQVPAHDWIARLSIQ